MSDKTRQTKRPPHDAAYKQFFSHPEMVASLLRDFVAEPFVPEMDLGTLQRLSGEYVGRGFVRGAGDTVWRARWRERDWCYVALLLEYQSRPDPLMPLRLTGYTAQLLLRLTKEDKSLRAGHLPAVLPIVIYTGDAPWNTAPDTIGMFEAALREKLGFYLPKQGYALIDLCRLDANRPELRDSLTALMARFRQAKTIEEIRAVLEDMARALKDYPELQRDFAQWTAMSLHFTGVPGNWERELNTIEEVRNMVIFDAAQWQKDWKAEGMAAGMAQGMAEGRAEEKTATVRQLLKMGGFSLESMAEITRLSLEEVRAIVAKERAGAAS